MKKLLLLILVLSAVASKSQTNVYHPFPDSAAVWNFYMFVNCGFHGSEFDYYSVQISGDTAINSHVYHKLTIPFVQHNGTDYCSELVGYQGAVRQDTSIKVIYFIPPADSIEQLLYDFNMQVGDTVRGFLDDDLLYDDVVQSIDSILVGNNYRKRWNINPSYNIYLIEGIGSTYGLIKSSPGNIVDQPDYSLTCFSQNGITLYPDTFTNCEIINRVKDISSNSFLTSIAPNPFHNSALLQTNSELGGVTMRIYNSIGLLVREDRIVNSEKYILNRGELRNGIYFVQLMNAKGHTANEKFIIE